MVSGRRKILIFKQLKWLRWRTFASGLKVFVFPDRRKRNTILIFAFIMKQTPKKVKETRKKLTYIILTKDFVITFSLEIFWRISL